MTDEKELREGLLSQNGIEPGALPEDRRKELRRILERDKKRVTRMKWATIVSWSLVGLFFVVGFVLGWAFSGEVPYPEFGLVFAVAGFYVAVAFTISWYLRSRSLSQRQIQATLGDISAQLEQLAKNQEVKTED